LGYASVLGMPAKAKPYSKNDLVRALQQFVDEAGPEEEKDPYFVKLLRDFFKKDPRQLPSVHERFPVWEHPTAHLALQKCLESTNGEVNLYGVAPQHQRGSITVADLVKKAEPPELIPVQYRNVIVDDAPIPCVQNGLFLFESEKRSIGVLLYGPNGNFDEHVDVSVISSDKEYCESFLSLLRRTMRGLSVYRGKVLSLSCKRSGDIMVHTLKLPKVERDQIILPEGLIERIERQGLLFSRHAEKLKELG
jgi:hypothetical protein